jgi:hypothetical protein
VSKPVKKAQSLGNANIGKLRLANGESSDEEKMETPIDDVQTLTEAFDRYKDGLGLQIRRTEIPVRPFPVGIERVTTPERGEEDNGVELAIFTEGIMPSTFKGIALGGEVTPNMERIILGILGVGGQLVTS